MDDAAAGTLYAALCDGDTSGVVPSPAVDAFYRELTGMHPELDDVAEDDVGNFDLSPWSGALDRSPGHVIMSCVWSKADYVEELVKRLACKHGLVVYDPQSERVTHPSSVATRRRPWWRFW